MREKVECLLWSQEPELNCILLSIGNDYITNQCYQLREKLTKLFCMGNTNLIQRLANVERMECLKDNKDRPHL